MRVIPENLRYRIGFIDDFRNSQGFVDFRQFGTLRIWDGSISSGPSPTYQKPTDCISVFLNFRKVGEFQSRELALEVLRELLAGAPTDLSSFAEYLQLS